MPVAAFAQAARPAPIDRNGVLILLRSTLLALDQANKTGNYTVFRDLAAPSFGTVNNPARLGDIFASERRDHLDLSGVAVLDPELTLLPQIEPNGLMHMTGFFPSVPKQVNFDLLYSPINGEWRLFGISVNVGPSGPVAPSAVPSPNESAAQAKPDARRRDLEIEPHKKKKKTDNPPPGATR